MVARELAWLLSICKGDIHFAMNSSGMYRASVDTNGCVEVKIYADD